MWIFTDIADWFDKQRVDNNKFLDTEFQGWIDYATKHENEPGFWPAIRNAHIVGYTGLLYALNQFTTTVASGFVDTLRIGDGVKKGGWGYAEDAMRLLVIAGPALRLARYGLAAVFAVDAAETAPICTWVGSTKALTLTGTKHFATVEKLAAAAGQGSVPANQLPPVFLGQLGPALRNMGADVTAVGASGGGTVEETLANVLKANPNAVAPFSVKWMWGATAQTANEFSAARAGTPVGHTMVAFRSMLTGDVLIMDRTGKIVRSLGELESSYSGISKAQFYNQIDTLVVMKNASIVTVLENGAPIATVAQGGAAWLKADDGSLFSDASWLYKGLAFEIRSLPFRVEKRRTVNVPTRVAPAKGSVQTQTVCISSGNSDMPGEQRCVTTREYDVQPGDTLQSIAQLTYGDPNRWRGIAAVNGIKNPDTIRTGTHLIIP